MGRTGMRDERYLYEQAPVGKAIISLTVPTVISQLITVIYNAADTFFIGQLNDPSQVAAASLCMPPFILLTGIANLFGIGGSSLISRCLGIGEKEKAKRAAAFCIWSAAAVALLYGLLFLLLKPYVLPLLGARASTYGYCYSYLFWTVTLGAVPTVMNACLAHLIRSEGLSRQAGFGVILGGLLNILLDPIFIFVLRLEIVGAAMATALSNLVAMLYFVLIVCLRRGRTVITASPRFFTLRHGIPREVCAVGLPNFVMNLLGIFSNTVLNNLMATYSDAAIAGMGIAKKVDMLTFAVSMGMTQGVLSLIGYNYSAKNHARMVKVIKTTFLYTMVVAVCTTLFLYFCAAPVSRVFIADVETITYGQHFIRVLCLICPMQATSMVVITTLQAIGKKAKPLLLSLMRKGTLDLPFMFLLNGLTGAMGVAWATPIAESIACIVSLFLFAPIFRRMLAQAKASSSNTASASNVGEAGDVVAPPKAESGNP